jgi:hypothetical protein
MLKSKLVIFILLIGFGLGFLPNTVFGADKPLPDWEGFCSAYCNDSGVWVTKEECEGKAPPSGATVNDQQCCDAKLLTALEKKVKDSANPDYNCAKGKTICPCSPIPVVDVPTFLEVLMGWMFNVVLVASVLMVLVGAFFMMISAGEPERAKRGRSIIIWAMIGLAVILSARLLSAIIKMILSGPSTT